MPNISDVARQAGVSKRTVSRVLNDDPSVLPRTRKLIMDAAQSLRYVPNQAARSLRGSRTRTIGLVMHEISATMLQLIPEIEEVVRERGYSLLICDSEMDGTIQAANLRRLYEHRVEGLIVFAITGRSPELTLFDSGGIPVLAIHGGDALDLTTGTRQVLVPARFAAKPVFQHLAGLGHRRIAFVNLDRGQFSVHTRFFREVTTELGLEYDSSLELSCDHPDDCFRKVVSLLTHGDRPTAIYSHSHSLCPYVLEGIQAAGVAIPDDLSFVTLGDSPWTRAYRPPLTTLSYDIVNRGRLMAEYIFARIGGDSAELLLDEILPVAEPRLISRGSCAPPPIRHTPPSVLSTAGQLSSPK